MRQRQRMFWAGALASGAVYLAATLLTPGPSQALPLDQNGHTICPPGASNRGGTGPGHSHGGQCLVTPTAVPLHGTQPH